MTGIEKVVGLQQPTKSTNINSNTGVQSTNINLRQKIDVSGRAAELGITVEQFMALCAIDSTFMFAGIKYQKSVIEQHIKPEQVVTPASSGLTASEQLAQTDVVPVATYASEAAEPVAQDIQAQASQVEGEPEEPIDDAFRSEKYNFRAFNELSGAEKLKVIFVELARNNYLYGDENNNRIPEDWENLSEDEKNALISEAKVKFSEKNKKEFERICALLEKSEAKSEILENIPLYHLETVLLANRLKTSVDDYEKKSFGERAEDFNEAYSLDMSSKNLTVLQIKVLQQNRDLTRAWGYFLATEGNQPENTYWWCAQNDNNFALSLACLKEQIAEYNKNNGTNIDIFDIHEKYMKYQLDNNLVAATEQVDYKKEYEVLVKYNKSSLKGLINTKNKGELIAKGDVKLSDPPVLDEMKYKLGYNASLTFKQKLKLVTEYLDSKLGETSSSTEKADIIVGLMYELAQEDADNGMLVSVLYGGAVSMGGEELQNELASKLDAFSIAANANNIAAYGENKEALDNIGQALTGKMRSKNHKERVHAESCSMETMDNATAWQNEILSEGFAGAPSEKVQNHHVATAYRINRENPENGDIVAKMLTNVALCSTDKVRAGAVVKVGELAAEHEIPVMTALTKDCAVATAAAVDNDVATTLDVENQVSAVELLGNNIQTQFEGEDVDKYLTTLADNIKNLDVSNRQAALDSIYETGNQEAINKAVENLASAPSIVQEIELSRIFVESVMGSDILQSSDLVQLDLSKQLSSVEIASLSPIEKREYYLRLFVNASVNDKIKILDKLPNGAQKQTVFAIIARFAPRLLEVMIDSGMGPSMLASNLPFDASNKVLKAMIKSENPEVKKQVDKLISDGSYSERFENIIGIDEKNITKRKETGNVAENNYMSLPEDLVNKYGVSPTELEYIQKTLWPHDYIGRYNA